MRGTLTRDGQLIGSTERTFAGVLVARRDPTGATGGLVATATDGSGRVMTMRFEAGPGFIGDPTTWQITVLDR